MFKMKQREKEEFFWGWALIFPTMIGLIVLNIIPIISTIRQSFYRTGDFGRGNKFVGLANYQKMFHDKEIWQALLNTLQYALVEVVISIALALILAVLLNKNIKFRAGFRTIFFLPMIAAPAAIAMVWRWLYNSDFGLINHIFHTSVHWVSDPKIAIYSIAVIGIWSVLGYNIVLLLAGLQEIPKDFYEASAIDGASPVTQFFKITIPLLSPMLFFVLITRVIGALQVFDLIYMVIDKTNPALSKTQSLVYIFYRYSFMNHNYGYGSTVVVLLLAVIMLVTVVQMKVQKKWVFYN